MYRARSKDRRRQEPTAAARAAAEEKAAEEEAKEARRKACLELINMQLSKREIELGWFKEMPRGHIYRVPFDPNLEAVFTTTSVMQHGIKYLTYRKLRNAILEFVGDENI